MTEEGNPEDPGWRYNACPNKWLTYAMALAI